MVLLEPGIDLSQHKTGSDECPACAEGYPEPHSCGGHLHAVRELLEGNGAVLFTECDRCHQPATP